MALLVCCDRFCQYVCRSGNMSTQQRVGASMSWQVLFVRTSHAEPHIQHTHGGERRNKNYLLLGKSHSQWDRSTRTEGDGPS